MSIITWIIFGAIAGWLASLITGDNARIGILGNIVVGILGAVIGGFIAGMLDIGGVSGFNLTSILTAVAGAVILLAIIGMFSKRTPV